MDCFYLLDWQQNMFLNKLFAKLLIVFKSVCEVYFYFNLRIKIWTISRSWDEEKLLSENSQEVSFLRTENLKLHFVVNNGMTSVGNVLS